VKTLITLILTILLLGSCRSTKSTSESPNHSNVELTSGDSINLELGAEAAGEEPDEITSSEIIVGSGSGIGLGSYGTIGHGAGSASSNSELRIINIPNNKVLNTTTNQGYVAYKIPTEMSIRSTYQVMVRISKSSVNIYENLNGEVRTSTIPITQTMEVKVIDPSPADSKFFDIVPDNNAVQLIENGEDITQWTWNVTPIKTGHSNLKIVISIIKDGNKKEIVYEDSVRVKMDIGKQVPFFFGKYWQWLLSTLVIPFVIWFYNKRKKDKEENKQ
jgi:hypothetical protein